MRGPDARGRQRGAYRTAANGQSDRSHSLTARQSGSSRCAWLDRTQECTEASKIDDARAREQLEAAQAELEAIERGDSTADRWQTEQRIRHAENQLAVSGRG